MLPSSALRTVPTADEVPDEELVRRALMGDRWAQGAMYQRHAPRLLNTAARLLASKSDALDVVQEVFVEALEGLAGLREPAALGGWLLARVVNKAERRLKRGRWLESFGLAHAPELHVRSLAVPQATTEQLVELERLLVVVRELPVRQRVCWVLHRIDGETLPAVASLVGISLASVKRDIAAAAAAIAESVRNTP